jgi:hypothetical protein
MDSAGSGIGQLGGCGWWANYQIDACGFRQLLAWDLLG